MEIAGRLARVWEIRVKDRKDKQIFVVHLSIEDHQFLTASNPNLEADIAEAAKLILIDSGGVDIGNPQVRLVADSALARHKVMIEAHDPTILPDSLENTQAIQRKNDVPDPISKLNELDAFLIIQGKRHVQLEKPLITIGRQIDNDIVIEKGSVSRKHAQLRWRFGRFILYDISMKGKTMVNGHSILEHLLQPGDVIALSDALLIYGEGNDRTYSHAINPDDDIGDTIIRSPRQ